MRSRSAFIAWCLFGAYGLVSVAWVVLAGLNGDAVTQKIPYVVVYGSFGYIGALIASRRPENSLGWIFLAIAIGANAGNAASSYATYTLVTSPGSLGGGAWAASFGEALWPAAITMILLPMVLFPGGRATTRLHSWLLRLAVVAIVFLNTGSFLLHERMIRVGDGISVENPMGIGSLDGVLQVIAATGGILVPVVAALAVVRLIVQARRAHGDERQQFKWFGYSALAMVVVNFGIANLVKALFPELDDVAGGAGLVVGLSFIPIGVGIAVLKYRLYDLERIVNRTLVYAALTAILAGTYVGIVVLLQRALGGVTADSDLAIAGSTLAVAALFRPLRSRVQTFIDHRFYRRKYDAAETLGEFSARLRDQVDLDALGHELVAVVGSTMQPAHASLWLRQEGAP